MGAACYRRMPRFEGLQHSRRESYMVVESYDTELRLKRLSSHQLRLPHPRHRHALVRQ